MEPSRTTPGAPAGWTSSANGRKTSTSSPTTLPRYARAGTAVPHTAQAFGFDLGPGEDSADVTLGSRVSRHEFGDTKHRRIVYHSIATTRFREYLPRPIADDPDAIQQREAYRDASDGLASGAHPGRPQLRPTGDAGRRPDAADIPLGTQRRGAGPNRTSGTARRSESGCAGRGSRRATASSSASSSSPRSGCRAAGHHGTMSSMRSDPGRSPHRARAPSGKQGGGRPGLWTR